MSTARFLINCAKRRTLVDEIINIGLENLPRNAPVTIHTQIHEHKYFFSSHSHFVSDADGTIATNKQPSVGGSYTGVDPMGMFWSMDQNPGQRSGLRLLKRDITTPLVFELKAFEGHLNLEEAIEAAGIPSQITKEYKFTVNDVLSGSDIELCKGTVERWYLSENVKREPIRGDRIRGTLFYPRDSTNKNLKFPAVIDMFGTGGGLFEHRAALLASKGFMVLSLALFRYQDLPDTYDVVDLEYMDEAIEFLASHSKSLSPNVGVIGLSKGADIALQMAIEFPKVRAAVVVNGDPYYTHGPMMSKDVVTPYMRSRKHKITMSEDGIADFSTSFRTFEEYKDWMFPIEKSKNAEFLIFNCTLDTQVPTETGRALTRRLATRGEGARGTAIVYEGGGHLLEPPYSPCGAITWHKLFGTLVRNGGSPKQHNIAQIDSWKRTQSFLHDKLGQAKSKL